MSELKNTTKAALAAALGALCAYGVQLLAPVLVLVVVMLLDYATGMAKAWNAGELSSRVGLRGILKKVGYVATVGVAAVVDWLLRYGAGTLAGGVPVCQHRHYLAGDQRAAVHPGECVGHGCAGAGLRAVAAAEAQGAHRAYHGRRGGTQ